MYFNDFKFCLLFPGAKRKKTTTDDDDRRVTGRFRIKKMNAPSNKIIVSRHSKRNFSDVKCSSGGKEEERRRNINSKITTTTKTTANERQPQSEKTPGKNIKNC